MIHLAIFPDLTSAPEYVLSEAGEELIRQPAKTKKPSRQAQACENSCLLFGMLSPALPAVPLIYRLQYYCNARENIIMYLFIA